MKLLRTPIIFFDWLRFNGNINPDFKMSFKDYWKVRR